MSIGRTAVRAGVRRGGRSCPLRLLMLGVATVLPLACQDGRNRDAATPATVAEVSDGEPMTETPAVIDGAEHSGDAGRASLVVDVPGRTPTPVRRMGNRRVHTEAFDTLWHRGGSVDDSLLLFPFSMEADDTNVYVFDRGAMRIVAFDIRTGQPRWTFGRRGGGPGEFGDAVDLAPGADGGLRFLDERNRRFMEITPGGQLVREWPFRSDAPAEHSCALADGTTLVTGHHIQPFEVLRVDAEGEIVQHIPLPWPDLDTIAGGARQARLAPVGNGRDCIFAFAMGRGFARLSPDGAAYAARYVDHFELAQVVIEREGRSFRWSFAPGVVYATFSISVDRDTLVTLFIGPRDALRERFLDHYDPTTGTYLYSRLLDTGVEDAVRANGTYFVFSLDGDFPSLTALRVRQEGSL